MDDIDPIDQPRRRSLRVLLWSAGAAVAVPAVWVGGRFMSPPRPMATSTVVGPASAIPPDGARLLKVGVTDAAVLLNESGVPYALNLKCTHAGCTVAWREGQFVCPCHGARFDRAGRVLKGPARLPLVQLEVRVENGDIVLTDIPAAGDGAV